MKLTLRERSYSSSLPPSAAGGGWIGGRIIQHPSFSNGARALRRDLDAAEVEIKGPYHEFYVNGTMTRRAGESMEGSWAGS